MLKPAECFTGPISNAKQMTLVLPRASYEHRALIVIHDEKAHAICLDEAQRDRFMAFECDENESWQGLHIPGVGIELDETSLYDADDFHLPLGSMVRQSDQLALGVNLAGRFNARNTTLTVLAGLPPCAEHYRACFQRWQIVLGEGDDKRVLYRVDAGSLGTNA